MEQHRLPTTSEGSVPHNQDRTSASPRGPESLPGSQHADAELFQAASGSAQPRQGAGRWLELCTIIQHSPQLEPRPSARHQLTHFYVFTFLEGDVSFSCAMEKSISARP